MMERLWLACCRAEDAATVQREIEARDERPRVLRLGDIGRLATMARACGGEASGAAILVRGVGDDELVQAVGDLARLGSIHELAVFTERLDAALIARLFDAGATEVIAAEGAAAPSGADKIAHKEVGLRKAWSYGASAGDDDADDAFPGGDAGETGMVPPLPAPRDRCAADERGHGCQRCEGCAKAAEHAGAEGAGGLDGGEGLARPESQAVRDAFPSPAEPLRAEGDRMTAAVAEGSSAMGARRGDPLAAEARGAAAVPGARRDGAPSPEPAASVSDASPAVSSPTPGASGPRAPLVAVISGRGGSGKTTLVAAMASCASLMGLRVAVLDLDLMFGNLAGVLGVDDPVDLALLGSHRTETGLAECDVEGTAMRVAPGLTMWGPCGAPEMAETVSAPVEELVGLLRGAADLIVADTSVFWGDAAAMAVAACDRCLVVGDAGPAAAASARRAVGLAGRIGVPATRMTCVFNRFDARGGGEEAALRFEMGTSLRSRARIADGGEEVAGSLSLGHIADLATGDSAFGRSVRAFTHGLVSELGCAVPPLDGLAPAGAAQAPSGRPRFRLPWSRRPGEPR